MKNIILTIAIMLILSISDASIADDLAINGDAAILIDFDTGVVLFEKNPHKPQFPASTTKMVTAILAVENSELSDLVTVQQEVISLTSGSHIALEPGEILTMEQMLHALLLPSANDAALAIAIHIGGSIENFTKLMNEKAVEIGALNSNFVNPNGLHDDRHVSTAYDMAMIGRYAMNNQIIRSIVNKTTYEIPPTNKKTESRHLWVTNKLLFSNESILVDGKYIPIRYPQASGVKTGFTSKAGNCLVSFAEENDQRLISSILKADGSNNIYTDTHNLLKYGFNYFDSIVLTHKNEFIGNSPVENGIVQYVGGIAENDLSITIKKDGSSSFERAVLYDEGLLAPIKEGDKIGKVKYFLKDGTEVGSVNILATAEIQPIVIDSLAVKLLKKWYLFVFLFLILLRLYVLKRNKIIRKRRLKTRTQNS